MNQENEWCPFYYVLLVILLQLSIHRLSLSLLLIIRWIDTLKKLFSLIKNLSNFTGKIAAIIICFYYVILMSMILDKQ